MNRFIRYATTIAHKPKLTIEQITEIYNKPLLELVYQASTVHRQNHNPNKIQLCTLLNIKSGGCTEDCSYCSQSSRHKTDSPVTKLMEVDQVLQKAREAKANGSTRFCMGSAWRDMAGRKTNMKNICEMVSEIKKMDMEVCTTLGMINEQQAMELKNAGLTAYNHNIDTSKEFYPKVITTRSFDERLETIQNVKAQGIKVCTGGILGLGESVEDRVSFLQTLHEIEPESLLLMRWCQSRVLLWRRTRKWIIILSFVLLLLPGLFCQNRSSGWRQGELL